MSINHFMNKIKGQIGIDSTTIIFLFILILIGLSSFGLGRLSVPENNNEAQINIEDSNFNLIKGEVGKSQAIESSIENIENIPREKMYVASKNGKLYYSKGCSGAKRIAVKNEVWFATKIEAEKSGYALSTSCK